MLAIIITIMVLEMKVPQGSDWAALRPLLPVFLSYVLSFVYLAIYWNNHHHLLKACRRANSSIMWSNMHLLFWLSLLPFVTGWMGGNHFAPLPTSLYGTVLLLAAIAYFVLQQTILADHGKDSKLASEFGKDWKGKLSMVAYLLGAILAFGSPLLANAIFVAIALMWLIPDRRIERVVSI